MAQLTPTKKVQGEGRARPAYSRSSDKVGENDGELASATTSDSQWVYRRDRVKAYDRQQSNELFVLLFNMYN